MGFGRIPHGITAIAFSLLFGSGYVLAQEYYDDDVQQQQADYEPQELHIICEFSGDDYKVNVWDMNRDERSAKVQVLKMSEYGDVPAEYVEWTYDFDNAQMHFPLEGDSEQSSKLTIGHLFQPSYSYYDAVKQRYLAHTAYLSVGGGATIYGGCTTSSHKPRSS